MEERVVVIVGASGYFGSYLSEHFLRKGFRTFLLYKNNHSRIKDLKYSLKELSNQPIVFSLDILQEEKLEEIAEEIYSKFNRIDILINSIGKFSIKNLYSYKLDEFQEIITNNLLTVFLTCKTFIPYMRKRRYGRVINFAYSNAEHLFSRIRTTPYAIAKAGVITLSRSLAKIEARNNITINVISPGIIGNGKINKNIKIRIPARRVGEVEEILNVIDFLISDEASYLTGSNIIVSGGLHI